MTDPFKDGRKDRLGDFAYGPKESPDYVEYIPEVFTILDLYFDTPAGTEDALRLARLARQKLWGESHGPNCYHRRC